MEKKLNAIGLDVFQMAAVKRSYQNVKSLIVKRDKLQQKAAELMSEAELLNEQIMDGDAFTLKLTERVIGKALTSEQCMYYVEHPEEFKEITPKEEKDTAEVTEPAEEGAVAETVDWE